MKRGIYNLVGFSCIFYGNHFLSFVNHNCLTAKQTLNAAKNPNAAGCQIKSFKCLMIYEIVYNGGVFLVGGSSFSVSVVFFASTAGKSTA